MTTIAALNPPVLEIVPGEEGSTVLTIRNDGDIVEAYRIDILGPAAEWAEVQPPHVSLYPGASAEVQVAFRPPRSERVAARDLPFAVRVLPQHRPERTVAPEGAIRVLPFAETTVELLPRTSKGRKRVKHEIAIDNRGNAPLGVKVTAADPNGEMRFAAKPDTLRIPPGTVGFTRLSVKHRRMLWRGGPNQKTFEASVLTDGRPEPYKVTGTTQQDPFFSAALFKLAAAAVALGALAAALWFMILKPAINSAAKDAAEEQAAAEAPAFDEPPGGADGGGPGAEGGDPSDGTKPDGAGSDGADSDGAKSDGAGSDGKKSDGSTALDGTGRPTRVDVSDAAGGDASWQQITALKIGEVYTWYGFMVQAPQGDQGTLEVTLDDKVLATYALANLRDYDYRWPVPIKVGAGERIGLRLTCQKQGPMTVADTKPNHCRAFLLVTGELRRTDP